MVHTKTCMFTYFTNNIRSYLLWSPVLLHQMLTARATVRCSSVRTAVPYLAGGDKALKLKAVFRHIWDCSLKGVKGMLRAELGMYPLETNTGVRKLNWQYKVNNMLKTRLPTIMLYEKK